ncbi:MAG: (E)-4-hydroxy-3-methylbut-2-enyl-diphosphate synthase [Treponema sp.]|nr:(E)-4-hydroxy-3-methylbut-2-enyl-diphosphate synthase [Treponema sp.]
MKLKRMTKVIRIGGFSQIHPVFIGGEYPIVIQTMYKDRLSLSSIDETVKKIEALQSLGCGLLRFAVPDIQSAQVFGSLCEMVTMPLCADIHFDYKIALRCMDFPVSKIRINPGNIGSKDKVRAVLEKAAAKNIPIRIGVNAGSLPNDLQKRIDENGIAPCEALVEAAEREIAIFNEFGFGDFLVSMKACTIADNVKAGRLLSQRTDAPLHIGVTEAGPLTAGVARNTAAILTLLNEGIGDTVRVSLSDTMESEIIAGREIAAAAAQFSPENKRLSLRGVNIVSCPRCGRHSFDTHAFTDRWMHTLYAMDKNITVAVMGCEVNGPAEAKHASLGITGAGDKVLIFKHGKIIRTITADKADTIFKEELKKL